MKINIRYPIVFLSLLFNSLGAAESSRPNILFCLSDDQSWPHASAYGEPMIKTPAFDRVAKAGALFSQVYCAASSCTPSRSAILTGQDIWRLGEGGQLFGTLPRKVSGLHRPAGGQWLSRGLHAQGMGARQCHGGRPEIEPGGTSIQELRGIHREGSRGQTLVLLVGQPLSPPAVQEGQRRDGGDGPRESRGSRFPPGHTRGAQRSLRLLPGDSAFDEQVGGMLA